MINHYYDLSEYIEDDKFFVIFLLKIRRFFNLSDKNFKNF